MKLAPILSNEKIRLQTLLEYHVLDTQEEQVFEDITQLAASICKTPIALVSLVDQHRQWFKSHHGLNATETPRDISFCGHAIQGNDIFEIKDAFRDSRFSDNPLVTGAPVVRFYAGAPLVAPNGQAIGTLCVIDHVPNELTEDQRNSLRALARHIVGLMELRISNAGVRAANIDLVKAQKNLEENRRLLNNVLDSLPNLVSYMDRHLCYRYVNSAYEQWFGIKSEMILGKTMTEVLGEKAVESVQPYVHRVLGGERVEFERTISYKIGGSKNIHVIYIPEMNFEGKVDGFIAVVRDTTEAKQIRDDLLRANQEAMAAVKSKAEFLANMSHEIRTPMNGIIGMTNLLLSDEINFEQKERLKIIQNCGNSLLDLVNDVLDFSKLEAQKIELEKESFDVQAISQEIVELFKGRASEKKLEISYLPEAATPRWIMSDSTRFRQILTNLVSNAIKFTEQGKIEIQSTSKALPDGMHELQFTVSDSGIGIPAEVKEKLFASFAQADASTTRRFGGTGLGLAICKGLCEKMGGRIWVKSEPGEGSAFSFTFFAELGIEADSATMSPFSGFDPKMGEENPLRILVAEDNRTNQLVAVGLLKKLGYQADVAGNGKEALECLRRKRYDLVLMDCQMPVMDGFEATKRIINELKIDRPRIVALTASTGTEDLNRCRDSGMDGFVPKPITIQTLVQTLLECQNLRVASSFDRNVFLTNFKGMEDLAVETIRSFLSNLPELLLQMEKSIDAENLENLKRSAHTLKGSVSIFHAFPARALAAKIEKMTREGNFEEAEKKFTELKPVLQKLVEDLQLQLLDLERRSVP